MKYGFLLLCLVFSLGTQANMIMNEKMMIMNANPDKLPRDCQSISEEVNITVRAGHKHALKFAGKMFAFDTQEWSVKPCAKINVTFINEDQIRHQMMVHGLPGYLYPEGMVHFELYGEGELKASFIVPSRPKTYLVHCELPQHAEKGMKAQLKVNGGDGDLAGIPDISAPTRPDSYTVDWTSTTWGVLVLCVLLGIALPFIAVLSVRRLMELCVAIKQKIKRQP